MEEGAEAKPEFEGRRKRKGGMGRRKEGEGGGRETKGGRRRGVKAYIEIFLVGPLLSKWRGSSMRCLLCPPGVFHGTVIGVFLE